MQQELKELQPELIETSKETEQLIKIIADETLEVEDKKRVNCTTQNHEIKNILIVITKWLFCFGVEARNPLAGIPEECCARISQSVRASCRRQTQTMK